MAPLLRKKVQDKSYGISCLSLQVTHGALTSDRMERILYQLSNAIILAINGTETRHKFIPRVLRDLVKLENRPRYSIRMAYECCSVIFENRRNFKDWESSLLFCLETSFRHLDLQSTSVRTRLSQVKYHRETIDVIFRSRGKRGNRRSPPCFDHGRLFLSSGVHITRPLSKTPRLPS